MLDASAAVEMILRTGRGESIAARALEAGEQLHAPHLVDVELTQTLRRLLIARQLTAARAEEAFEDFGLLVIERHEHRTLISRVWALKASLSAYDAVYVALAESLDAPLLTCDERLARARGHGARIELVLSP